MMLELWVSSLGSSHGTSESTISEDALMFGYVIALLEVLIHAAPFWARLKQSEVLTSMVVRVQDNQR